MKASTIICSNCKRKNISDIDTKYCDQCKTEITCEYKKCGHCNTMNFWDAKSCRSCGSNFPTNEMENREASVTFQE